MIEILRQHGFYGLSGWDGYSCGVIRIQGIEISVRCRRVASSDVDPSFSGIEVSIDNMGGLHPTEAMSAIADEMVRQIHDREPDYDIALNFKGDGAPDARVVRYADVN